MSIEQEIHSIVLNKPPMLPDERYRAIASLIHRQRLEAQREVLEGLDEPIWELDRDGSGHFNIDDIRAVITERMAAIEAELKGAE